MKENNLHVKSFPYEKINYSSFIVLLTDDLGEKNRSVFNSMAENEKSVVILVKYK